jgi:hypothetical protein
MNGLVVCPELCQEICSPILIKEGINFIYLKVNLRKNMETLRCS